MNGEIRAMQQAQFEAKTRVRLTCNHARLLCPNCGEMMDHPNPHPRHDCLEGPNFINPAQPLKASFFTQLKRQWGCHKRGGHWWHATGMIAWFCCQCGKTTDGLPKDGH